MTIEYETLTVTLADRVATVTLNRPDVRNAFNDSTIAELTLVFEQFGRSDAVRAVVLAANGAAFCAGADLNHMKKMATYSDAENMADAVKMADMLRTIYLCPKPVVAKVQGDCYAGGMGLVAACDIAVASASAHFCLSEVRLGLIPATISPYVIQSMGQNAARRYFLSAERFTAQEALRIGFVHEVAGSESLHAHVAAIAAALVANGPNAVALAKQLVRDVAGQPLTDALVADTAERIAHVRASAEGRDGLGAFLDKRTPAWQAG